MKRLALALSLLFLAAPAWAASFGTIASDDFNRADQNPVAGNWSTATGVSAMRILTNALNPSSGAADCASYYSATTFPNNQFARADLTILTATSGGGRGVGVRVRQAAAANTNYEFIIDHAAANNANIRRTVAGVFSSLDTWTQTYTDADTFTLAVATSGSTQVLRVYRNGTLVRTYNDANTSVLSGYPGASYSSNEGSGIAVDNFVAGSFSTASPAAPILLGNLLLDTLFGLLTGETNAYAYH